MTRGGVKATSRCRFTPIWSVTFCSKILKFRLTDSAGAKRRLKCVNETDFQTEISQGNSSRGRGHTLFGSGLGSGSGCAEQEDHGWFYRYGRPWHRLELAPISG